MPNGRAASVSVGAAPANRVRLALCLGLLACLPRAGAVCGEHEECSGLGPGRQALIRAKLFKDRDFTKENCEEVLVGHVLHYQPTGKCEDATHLYRKIAATCAAGALNIVAPARLCDTPKSVELHNYVTLNVVYVVTSLLFSEWVHFGKTSPFV